MRLRVPMADHCAAQPRGGREVEITLMRGKDEKKVTVELALTRSCRASSRTTARPTPATAASRRAVAPVPGGAVGPAGPGSRLRPGLLASRFAHIEARGAVPSTWDSPSFLIDPLGTEENGSFRTDKAWFDRAIHPVWRLPIRCGWKGRFGSIATGGTLVSV